MILNSRLAPTILRNDSPRRHHWLQIRLESDAGNRFAIGTRVTIRAGPLLLVDEVHSGRSYQSHCGLRLHFGLGQQERVDSIRIRWPGGGVDLLRDLLADQMLTIHPGGGLSSDLDPERSAALKGR